MTIGPIAGSTVLYRTPTSAQVPGTRPVPEVPRPDFGSSETSLAPSMPNEEAAVKYERWIVSPEMRRFLEEKSRQVAADSVYPDLRVLGIETQESLLANEKVRLEILESELSGADEHLNRLADELNGLSARLASAAPEEKSRLRLLMDLTGADIFHMQKHYAERAEAAPGERAALLAQIAQAETNLSRLYAERPDLAPAAADAAARPGKEPAAPRLADVA